MGKYATFWIAGNLRCIGAENAFKQVEIPSVAANIYFDELVTYYLHKIRPLASLQACVATLVSSTVGLIMNFCVDIKLIPRSKSSSHSELKYSTNHTIFGMSSHYSLYNCMSSCSNLSVWTISFKNFLASTVLQAALVWMVKIYRKVWSHYNCQVSTMPECWHDQSD